MQCRQWHSKTDIFIKLYSEGKTNGMKDGWAFGVWREATAVTACRQRTCQTTPGTRRPHVSFVIFLLLSYFPFFSFHIFTQLNRSASSSAVPRQYSCTRSVNNIWEANALGIRYIIARKGTLRTQSSRQVRYRIESQRSKKLTQGYQYFHISPFKHESTRTDE